MAIVPMSADTRAESDSVTNLGGGNFRDVATFLFCAYSGTCARAGFHRTLEARNPILREDPCDTRQLLRKGRRRLG